MITLKGTVNDTISCVQNQATVLVKMCNVVQVIGLQYGEISLKLLDSLFGFIKINHCSSSHNNYFYNFSARAFWDTVLPDISVVWVSYLLLFRMSRFRISITRSPAQTLIYCDITYFLDPNAVKISQIRTQQLLHIFISIFLSLFILLFVRCDRHCLEISQNPN